MLVSPAPSKLRVVEEVISLNPEVPLHALADGKYLAEHKVARFITRNLELVTRNGSSAPVDPVCIGCRQPKCRSVQVKVRTAAADSHHQWSSRFDFAQADQPIYKVVVKTGKKGCRQNWNDRTRRRSARPPFRQRRRLSIRRPGSWRCPWCARAFPPQTSMPQNYPIHPHPASQNSAAILNG
jgi:hypothetical protein